MSQNEEWGDFITDAVARQLQPRRVKLQWLRVVTEIQEATITVEDLVELINLNVDPGYGDAGDRPVTAVEVRTALDAGTFLVVYGDVLARKGDDWEAPSGAVTVTRYSPGPILRGAQFTE